MVLRAFSPQLWFIERKISLKNEQITCCWSFISRRTCWVWICSPDSGFKTGHRFQFWLSSWKKNYVWVSSQQSLPKSPIFANRMRQKGVIEITRKAPRFSFSTLISPKLLFLKGEWVACWQILTKNKFLDLHIRESTHGRKNKRHFCF